MTESKTKKVASTVGPFFADPARCRALARAVERWEGTPFHPRVSILGRGTHCTGLMLDLAREVGVPDADGLELPVAAARYHEHFTASMIQGFMSQLMKTGRIKRVEDESLMIGDLLGIRAGKTEHHLAQVIDPHRVIHVDRKKGVLCAGLEQVRPLVRSVYRIYG